MTHDYTCDEISCRLIFIDLKSSVYFGNRSWKLYKVWRVAERKSEHDNSN